MEIYLSYCPPKHIAMSTPVLIHLSEYLREMYHFYFFTGVTPNFLEFNLLCYAIHEFFVKTQVTSNYISLNITISICYTNRHIPCSKFPPLLDTHACSQLQLSFTAFSMAFSDKADQIS